MQAGTLPVLTEADVGSDQFSEAPCVALLLQHSAKMVVGTQNGEGRRFRQCVTFSLRFYFEMILLATMKNLRLMFSAAVVGSAVLGIGTASAALASNENDGGNETGGFRLLGPGGVVTDGVNPVFHRSLRAAASSAYGYAPGLASKRRDHVKK